MKKKGFTLIELLAVIIVLGILAFILIPIIQDLIANARYAAAVDSVLNYVHEANAQAVVDVGGFEDYALDLSNNNRLETGITDSELAKIKYKGKGPDYVYLHFTDDGNLVSDGRFCIWNYSIDYRMDTGASKSNDDYCEPRVVVEEHYDLGSAIYYNVDTGKQCTEDAFIDNTYNWASHSNFVYVGGKIISRSLEAAPIGLHSGCMKFYVLKDENDQLTMIAANNIDELGPDKNETDSSKFGDRYTYWADIKEGSEKQNVKDFNNITNPQSNTHYVMDTLKEYTNNWKAVDIAEDYNYTFTYTVDDAEVTDSYTIPYKTDGYKARLITKNELEEIMTLDSNNKLWLGDYLTLHKIPYIVNTRMGSTTWYERGFWSSDAKDANSMYVMTDWNWGSADGSSTSDRYGVRPVITVEKQWLTHQEIFYAVPNIINTDVTYPTYHSGTVFYYNVTTGKACTENEALNNLSSRHTPVGVKSGCMKFYSLADSEYSDTISLILDHPIEYNGVEWNDSYKHLDWGNEIVYKRSLFFEPTTLLNQIASDIEGWQGLEEIDNYTTDARQYSSNCVTCSDFHYRLTIPYKDYGIKARLVTAAEMDEAIHTSKHSKEYTNFFYSDNKDKSLAYRGGSGHLGSVEYCEYEYKPYDPNCNPYGTVGYHISPESWLFKDYNKFSVTNEPSAEYVDWFDGSDSIGHSGYDGCYWSSDISYTDSGYDYGILFMCDQAHWELDKTSHMYRPVIELKKDKFNTVTKNEKINLVIDDTYNYQTTLSNPTYSILDTNVATIDSNGVITAKKVGITEIIATDGTNTEYSKIVVKHKPYTYLETTLYGKYVYYDPVADRACDTSDSKCDNATCKMYYLLGEDTNGNYLLYASSDIFVEWSARWAIDDDANAENKYGDMAYNHWYKVLESFADFSKDFKTEIWDDYVDYTTEEYVIPWSKPAYYENGNPVYAKARMWSVEDLVGMYKTVSDFGGNSLFELLHNTGTSTVINSVRANTSGPLSDSDSIYIKMQNYNSSNSTYYYVIRVNKSKVGTIYTSDSPIVEVLRSTAEGIELGQASWYKYDGQASEDGGLVDIKTVNVCTNYSGSSYCRDYVYAFGVTNGHVRVSGRNSRNQTIYKDITIDLQYSCGDTDMCGRVTDSCDNSEPGPTNDDPTDPGTTTNTVVSTTDTTPPVCVLEGVTQLTNGIQPRLTCTDDQSIPTIRSQWNVRPVAATGFDNSIGIEKSGTTATLPNGAGYSKTVTPSWTTNDPISKPYPNDCYYFRYGAQDAAGNWSFYITDKCYYGFSNTNSGRLTN